MKTKKPSMFEMYLFYLKPSHPRALMIPKEQIIFLGSFDDYFTDGLTVAYQV